MMRFNAVLLVFVASLSIYLVLQNNSNTTIESHSNNVDAEKHSMDALKINQRFEDMMHQLSVIQQQLTQLQNNPATQTSTSDRINENTQCKEYGDLMQQLVIIQRQLSESHTTGKIPVFGEVTETNHTDRSEKNSAGNTIVDTFIDIGSMNGNDLIQLHQHVSQMEPKAQQLALQRFISAVNEQRIDIDPLAIP